MIRKLILFIYFFALSAGFLPAQSFVKTADLFSKRDNNPRRGRLNIIQDPAIDTLIGRYILVNKNAYDEIGYNGMDGFRIQIYNSSNRNAKVESGKVRQKFMDRYPDIVTYQIFAQPGYYKIRVGNFRTRTEAVKLFLLISKVFPDAYIVPDIINFPDLNTK